MIDLDLNLLRVFDALHELRSVTRAASRLGLTQSAISHALGRLRIAIGDPLFYRGPGGLQATARALEIAPGVREGLAQLRGALTPSLFDPRLSDRHFTISTGSYFCAMLIPDLIARVRTVAPQVRITVVTPSTELLPTLDDGTVDMALGVFGKVPPRLLYEPLFREKLVWIAAHDNPLLDQPDHVERIARAPRLEITAGRPSAGQGSFVVAGGLEWRIATDGGSSRDRVVGIYDAVAAARLVAQTDLVARVPRQFALRAAVPGRLTIIDPASAGEGLNMGMVTHRRLGSDAGLTWLRALILAILPEVLAPDEDR
ncbi:MAG TPA: LysR family transcriptional regulator [Sphingobium sp.]|uniref:LysR family transcriptional regulator n=1 Tax=Sphingobium sp. TaxID=1912891 RepID=UPI002ED03328